MPSTPSPSKPLARLGAALGKAIGSVILAVLGVIGCGSTAKARIEREVRLLEKNRSLAVLPVNEIIVRLRVDDETRELTARYVVLRAKEPSSLAPLVLIHGTPDTLYTWSDLLRPEHELARQRDVYALEVVGHGWADGDLAPYTFDRCAAFVGAFIDALGVGPVHLAGNSYGGEFVWRAALDGQHRIASVLLLDSSGPKRPEGGFLPEEEAMREHPLAGIGYLLNSRDRIRTALDPQFIADATDDQVEEMFWVCDNRHNWNAMVDLARDENGDRFDELAELQRPVLLLWGADDLAYPPDAYATQFQQRLPAAELHVIENCGHYPHEERPAETAAAINRFLDRVEEERSRAP